MIQINKGIPVPDEAWGSKYPFREMEIGDSFFEAGGTVSKLQNAASHWRKKAGMKFKARQVCEDGVDGARIWRSE